MRRCILLMVCLWLVSLLHAQSKLELVSPNGELKVSLRLSGKIYYSIACNGDVLMKDNSLLLILKDRVLGENQDKNGKDEAGLHPFFRTDIRYL